MSPRPEKDSVEADLKALRLRPRIDRQIWGVYIGLVIISLIELYSASSREVTAGNILSPLVRHAGLLGVGCLIMIGLQRTHYQKFNRLAWLIVFASIAATLYTMFFGQVINGARRSFTLVFFTVQPSELLKFSAALLIAKILGEGQTKINGRPDVTNRSLVTVASVVLLFGVLLINQGLTNTLLLMSISMAMMVIGGVSWKRLGYVALVYGVLGGGYLIYSNIKADDTEGTEIELRAGQEHDRSNIRRSRLENYFRSDKYNDPITSENRQEQYSYIAQANGGITGVGPGNSRETARLPLAFSDYIYAIVIEDLGLVGGLIVMTLYLMLLARAGRIASQCKKAFPALLVIGMAVFIVFQALFHMAIVTGVFPVSGQPLPFISKGGSSVIISSVALGVMLSVSRFAARKGVKDEIAENMKGLSDTEKDMADNPTKL